MGTFLYWVAVAVVAGLILAGLGFAFRYLREQENREALRQRICRHDWKKIDVGLRMKVKSGKRPRSEKVGLAPADDRAKAQDQGLMPAALLAP